VAIVQVYDARTGGWEHGAVGDLQVGDEVLHDGHLLRVTADGVEDRGFAAVGQLAEADATWSVDGVARVPDADDWVLVLGEDDAAGHWRLRDLVVVGDGRTERFAFGGRVFALAAADGALAVRATGDVLGRVVDTFVRMAPEVIDAEIAFADGMVDVLTGTPNHPFWVDAVRDYVPLGELEVGTVLHVQGGGEAILVSKTWRQGDFEVFDFEVDGLHNFYARGEANDASAVLVHNSTGGESVDLFRAVSKGELDDIADVGAFRGGPGMEAKQFGMNLDETIDFADAIGDADAVIKVSVPKSSADAFDFSTDIDPHVFKSGVTTVQPGKQMDLLNEAVDTVEVVYP
jgi:hypothetical protein